nr:helix-turn-helix domain-containing protein [uncultured Jannaschia sp.]
MMGRAYSADLRGRFVAALDEGLTASEAGRRMRVAESTAIRWAAIWRREKRAEALPMGGDRRSDALEAHAATILGWIEETPDLFQRGIVARLAARGAGTSATAVARLLARHGIMLRKKRSSPPSSTGTPANSDTSSANSSPPASRPIPRFSPTSRRSDGSNILLTGEYRWRAKT